MVRLQEFSLALGVINNLIVCDRNDRILIAGDEIKKLLLKPLTDQHSPDSIPEFSGSLEAVEELKEKIHLAREQRKTYDFKIPGNNKNLLIFPANYEDGDDVIIALEDRLIEGNNIQSELRERVKELQCLYSISNELEVGKDHLDNALQQCTVHLSNGFQFPQFSVACIHLDQKVYGQKDCTQPCDRPCLTENIMIRGRKRGTISLCYLEDVSFLKESLFLSEEKNLMREISLIISRIIDRIETRKNLETKQKELVSKNRELTDLTGNLSRINNKLKAFLQAITDPIVVIDRKFNIKLSNKEHMVSGKCYENFFQADSPCEQCPARDAFATGKSITMERKFNSKYYSLHAYPIHNDDDDSIDSVLEICTDVTQDVEMKRQLLQSYKLASIGKLVAGVAHEINNPNTFIRGNINIIDEAFKDILPILDRAYEKDNTLQIARLDYDIFRDNIPVLVEDMKGGANRIKKIVDGLRNFAKKDEGLLTDDVDINSLVMNNLRFTEKEVRKHARLRTDLNPSLPTFKGNIQKLEQVLMNLLINASQAFDKGSVDGLISIETAMDKITKEIIIRIIDNGKGMNEHTQKHIFDPFFTTKRNRGGTGLGLSISYGIIREHSGRIEVRSQPGAGTTFAIYLPTLPHQQPQAENAATLPGTSNLNSGVR